MNERFFVQCSVEGCKEGIMTEDRSEIGKLLFVHAQLHDDEPNSVAFNVYVKLPEFDDEEEAP